MTEDDARKLLNQYADGLLEAHQARELEDVLSQSQRLQSELIEIEERSIPLRPLANVESGVLSEEMLTEALAPLRPSRSARIRLSEAMQDVHRRAEHMANTLPERGWMMFRLCFAFAAVASAMVQMLFFPRTAVMDSEFYVLHYVNMGVFAIGIIFIIAGRLLAQLETLLIGAISKKEIDPTRLEILMLEVFGIVSVLASGALYLYQGL